MRLHLVVLTAIVALLACARQPAKPSPEELARGQHLTRPFTPPGRCVGKPSQCVSDGQCVPPFSLCQEGTCCSGELCCPLPADAIALGKSEEDRALKCRPVRECFGEG